MKPLLSLVGLGILPLVLPAQGVTSAAIYGRVTATDGLPIAGATVRVTNLADGHHWEITTRASGSYLLEDVSVGGPYRIDAHAVGFAPLAKTGIDLALGVRFVEDFTLQPAVVELTPVTVITSADPVLNPGRNGPAAIATAEWIAARPNLGRDFLAVTLVSPDVDRSPGSNLSGAGGINVAGQNRRLNAFQIDGGLNSDPYIGTLPGRNTFPRPISLEALQEVQVLVAPFDVRYGGFVGGLANAVTRSGTNELHGSVFGFWSDGVLVGKDLAGEPAAGFSSWDYGGTIGGPIVHDRAHFFLNVDLQRRFTPDPGPLITDTAGGADLAIIGIRYADARRFQDILRDTFGLDPGTLGPANESRHAADVFAKLTVQLGMNSHLELSHHYTDGDRSDSPPREKGWYRLSSVDSRFPATAHASRLILTSLPGGRWSSEFVLSLLSLRDACLPTATYPLIRVTNTSEKLVAGTPLNCPTSSSTQGASELSENLTAGFGAHVLTLGTRIELLQFADNQLLSRAGFWHFRTLDLLAGRQAFHYERTLPGPSRTGMVKYRGREIGLYAQDRWRPGRSLTLTAGLRLDVPVLPDRVATNATLDSALGHDTGRLPSGALVWSPRLGVNYDVRGDGRTFVRGGIGLFAGRSPYAWVGSAYRDDGTQQLFLDCNLAAVPTFDPINQPATCAGGAGPSPRLTFFDPDVPFPQSLKLSVGADHRFPGGIVGTGDVLYTRAVHQWYYSDANLQSPVGVARGEGGRPLYGTFDSSGVVPARPDPALGQVVRVSDRSGDRSIAVSVQLRKRLTDHAEVSALYARTWARDRMSLTNPQAPTNLANTPLDGTLEDRRLRTSAFEIPHRVEFALTTRLPMQAWLSLLYTGASGTPYTYSIFGDANADGIGSGLIANDIVYVPRDRADIALDGNGALAGVGSLAEQDSVYALLDGFIEAEPCLRKHRGRILPRNSCRNPWFGTLNARLTKVLPSLAGQSLELTADVYNILNIVNRRWGLSRVTTFDPQVQLLQLAGYDATAGRGIYRVTLPGRNQVQDLASRWQLEISLRYVF